MTFATDAMFTGARRRKRKGDEDEEVDPFRDRWRTPPELFVQASLAVGPFTCDAAAEREANLAPRWFGPDHPDPARRDALDPGVTWDERTWLNNPYSLCLEFLAAAKRQADRGCTVAVLIFARTDTEYWWRSVLGRRPPVKGPRGGRAEGARMDVTCAADLLWIPGRIKFVLPPDAPRSSKGNSAPAPSVLVVFRPDYREEWPRNGVLLRG